ncbi:regulator of G-protein signaling 12-like isoform X2 [Haliotis rufescens]|uniref:regulator of G-protein signaling 12-like isoform X2 n=1 Tax=Haliotis rufescens TaxID=6454 RepID=UPI00201E7B43|nr:regulator of G-protein signaling 12-like isoform X2 [Haliotis rufescens]
MLRYRYVPKRSTRKEAVEEDSQGGPGQTTIRRRRQSSGTKVQMAAEAFPLPPEVAADPLSDDAGETDNSKDSGREGLAGMHQPRRRKKRPIHGVKTVAVTRGRSGYGFTISGQHPCVLSCIVAGSPAEQAGLKPGDYLVSVNCENVSRYSHDDVVRMVGLSTGTLELQVAENYNSSDSSDDDYPPRTKSRYPNRIRPRQAFERNTRDKHSNSDLNSRPHRGADVRGDNMKLRHRQVIGGESETSQNSSLTDGASQDRIYSSDQSAFHQYVSADKNSHRQESRASLKQLRDSKSNLQQDPRSNVQYGQSSRTSLHKNSKPPPPQRGSKSSLNSCQQTSKSSLNGMENATITSTGSVQFQELHSQNISGFQGMFPTSGIVSSHGLSSSGMSDPGQLPREQQAEGAEAAAAVPASPGYPEDDDSFDMQPPAGDIKAIVGYIGSIEMPSNSSRPHQRIQSLRNAVRRLRIEQKIHTLVLMEVDPDGVKLTNAMGAGIAHYPVDRLAFSGVCPDDKRFFGIVTLHAPSDDMSEMSVQRDDAPTASSCHIFMVDPELRSHNSHTQKAKAFNIQCTVDPETQRCLEFPRSATPIILSVANLYKDRPRGVYENDIVQSQALADPVRAIQRSSSNSSNSDSGLGFGREDKVNERVFVVDMPVDAAQNQGVAEASGNPTRSNPNHALQHLSPEVNTMPTPRHNSTRPQSAMEIRRGMNTSTSSEECWQGSKLNPRAMPDPISLWKARSSDDLERQNNAETLRMSMHKLLQARQRHASEQNLSSDTESQDSRDCFLGRNGFTAPRPVSAPFAQLNFIKSEKVEAVDLAAGKLSPRAFSAASLAKYAGRSPSAPPIPYFQGDDDDDDDDSEEEDDPFVRGIISRLNRDKALGLADEDPRRYSEGFALARKREKERTDVAALQKWTKTGSFRRNRGMKIQNPLSHSHESLIAGDGDQSIQKLLPANSVNSIVAQVAKKDDKDEVGRVAGWAVNFDKLLRDNGGVVVFTEFLKKEFSEENIVFWRLCEQYKQLSNDDERKARAKEIFTKHLSSKASEPVNVDSTSRQNAEKHLDNPIPSMFDMAQKHIWQLMKQDSYVRFLKSDMYKTYLMREMEGRQLELPHDQMAGASKDDKKNGKGKENEKRRRSLLPWRQNKNKHSNNKIPSDAELKRVATKDIKIKDKEVNNNLKKCPGPGIDLSTMRKEVFQTKEEMRDPNEGQFKFCRVVLPDGSTTVVCAKPGQSSRSVLGKLCEKRGLSIAAVDVFLLGSDKPLDLSEDVSTLGSKEVVIERRVLFRMDFPNKKSIGVKAKPNRTIRDVFKPILNKYGYRIENIAVQLSGHEELLDIDMLVSQLDNQRVVILTKETLDWVGEERPGMSSTLHRPPLPPTASRHKSGSLGNIKAGSLDEITNRIFEDLMKGKAESAHNFDELGIVELEKTKAPKNPDEHRLSGLFGLLRRESVGKAKDSKQPKSTTAKSKVTFALPKNETRPRSDPENEKLFELLSRAQSQRLDDQRGVGTDSVEIPEFLRMETPVPTDSPTTRGVSSTDLFDDVEYLQGHGRPSRGAQTPQGQGPNPSSRKVNKFTTFGTPGFGSSNQSFSLDGQMPSQELADEYFQMQPVVLDANEFDMENIENFYQTNVQQEHEWAETPHHLGVQHLTSPAPMASPERFSPRRKLHERFNEQKVCEAIDQTFMDQNKKGVTLNIHSSPRPPPPLLLTPREIPRKPPNYTPPPPLSEINKDLNSSHTRHSESSSFHRPLKHSGQVKDLASLRDSENLCSQPNDRLSASAEGNPGATPKHLGNTQHSQVVVDIKYGEETVTFV